MSRLMREGEAVVIRSSTGIAFVATLAPKARLRLGNKCNARADALLGQPYGATFVVQKAKGGETMLVADARTPEEMAGDESIASLRDAIVDGDSAEGNSNADFFDETHDNKSQTSQTLKQEDIAKLRKGGTTGEELVAAIATGSTTFSAKTKLSQEKYLRRKAKRHVVWLTAEEPTALSVLDVFNSTKPEKMLGLRRDTFSLLFTLGNVQPGARVVVLDGTAGFVSAALAQRVGPGGRVLHVNLNQPLFENMGCLNLSADERIAIGSCSLYNLLRLMFSMGVLEDDGLGSVTTGAETGGADVTAAGAAAMEVASATDEAPTESLTSAEAPSRATTPESLKNLRDGALARWVRPGFSSLLIVTKEAPEPVLLQMLSLLDLGGNFVVYNPSMSPLATCHHLCHTRRAAVKVQLIDTWTRKIQVAPLRTHPMMNALPPTGGILSGIRVEAGLSKSIVNAGSR